MPMHVVKPLDELEELLGWQCPTDFNKTSIPKLAKSYQLPNRRRTLICHDLKGGYLNDNQPEPVSSNNYVFYNWQYCDIFVYFSHHLVTIPPVGWVSAAHANSSLILGTLLTEWDKGAAICASMFEDKEKAERMVDKLVQIAAFYGFDGWLVNIENEIDPEQLEVLLHFVWRLTNKMKEVKSYSQVIWYDSVTIPDGKLEWQNELNDMNAAFFNLADGIFLNYCWKPQQLTSSLDFIATCHELGGDEKYRYNDVYVGVDVFGRGSLGGGGFNTKVALKECAAHEMSVALFAPAWTWECSSSSDEDNSDFVSRDAKFWSLIKTLLPNKVTHIELPFHTSFCTGIKETADGKKKLFLAHQQPIPSCVVLDDHSSQTSFFDETRSGLVIKIPAVSKKTDLNLFFLNHSVHGAVNLKLSYSLSADNACPVFLCAETNTNPAEEQLSAEDREVSVTVYSGVITGVKLIIRLPGDAESGDELTFACSLTINELSITESEVSCDSPPY